MASSQHVLTLSRPDRPGIISAMSAVVFEHGGDIREAQQYGDPETNRFFARVVFEHAGTGEDLERLKAAFGATADRFDMRWDFRNRADRLRVMLMVSKFDHCLADILYRWRIGELNMDVAAIVSNHARETYRHHDFGDVPFHHLPVSRDTKARQEAEVMALVHQTRTDLVILARYMQVLSDDLAGKLSGRCINIHHSFLPGFKGAKPYHQAHARGVKLIGATAHYVTADLDEGPIIEQDVERISHHDTPEDLVRQGRDIERRVLSRALRWHLDGRVLMNDSRTVIFRD